MHTVLDFILLLGSDKKTNWAGVAKDADSDLSPQNIGHFFTSFWYHSGMSSIQPQNSHLLFLATQREVLK